jgi:cysteinyl-tRNA synthetase
MRRVEVNMKLYCEVTGQMEKFVPLRQPATIYVCGITPYDTTHLGHAFTYASFDTLIRYLEYAGNNVLYVQNVTDIDDDILRKAREVGDDWQQLGNLWTRHFIRDMQALNVRPPEHYTRATDFIPGIISAVQRLIEVGVAYEAGASVYFHIAAWPEYGEVSQLPPAEMLPIANERGNNPADPNKRDPLDFVLWQAQAPGEPAWPSPWGPGRPGWHIECSTMATRLLGNSVDIHGGGADLLFPHHESETAQAEAATGQEPFVRFWLHTAMVRHDGEKMSKSLGNLVMVSDLLKTCSPDALRLYLADHHYREAWSYDAGELDKAGRLADLLSRAVQPADPARAGTRDALDPAAAEAAFVAAMDRDLDTPAALVALADLATSIREGARAGVDVRAAQQALRRLGTVFGLRLDAATPEDRVLRGWNEHAERFGP